MQWARRNYDFRPIVAEPTLEVTNLLIMGKTTSDLDFYEESRWQGSTSLLWLRGGHHFKAGLDVNAIQDEAGWDLFFPARIIFPNLNAFLNFTPVVFWWPVRAGQTHPGFDVPFDQAVPAAWQDATRFDFSYDSFGLFHDRLVGSIGQVFTATSWSSRGDSPNAPVLFPAVARIPGHFRQTTAAGPAAIPAAMAFLTTGRTPAAGATSLTDNMSSELVNPYSYQASAQIAQAFGRGFAVSVSYLLVRGHDLPRHTGNLNAFQTGTLSTGKPIIAGRRFAELGNFHVTDNLGWSRYHGGTVELKKQFRGAIGFTASYTLSEARTNVESITNLGDFPDGADFSREDALSRQHLRHRGTFSFVSQVPKDVAVLGDFKLAALVTVESGRFFTIFAGADANGDGNPNADRLGLEDRNSLEGPELPHRGRARGARVPARRPGAG